jgi:ribonuclease D
VSEASPTTPGESRPRPRLETVDTPEALSRLAQRLANESRIALDSEADSLHAYREKVCVVQTSVPGLDAIVDPLRVPDLSPLAAALARDDLEVVLHGGDYDVLVLSRDHGFAFRRVFDTMIAATLLGEERVGLAALVEKEFGVHLDKRHQKADWRERPFTPDRLEYLRNDTTHLLALRDALAARLETRDLVEEAAIEFRRLAARRGAAVPDDAEAWRKAKGADRLDPTGRAVLARAWAWREGRARAKDVPKFKVMLDAALVAVAENPPRTMNEVRAIVGPGPAGSGRGEELLDAVLAGLQDDARGGGPPAVVRPRLSPEERRRLDRRRAVEDRFRAWRTDEAKRRGVPNVVVLPNPGMDDLLDHPPADAADLASRPDVGAKRAATYGDVLLRFFARTPTDA